MILGVIFNHTVLRVILNNTVLEVILNSTILRVILSQKVNSCREVLDAGLKLPELVAGKSIDKTQVPQLYLS